VLIGYGGSSPAHGEEDDGDGEARRGSRARRRRAEKTPVALLLQFPACVLPAVAQRGGAACTQYLAGGAGDVERERAGKSEGVWEIAGSGVSSFICSEGFL
jgi:hypothetical protein